MGREGLGDLSSKYFFEIKIHIKELFEFDTYIAEKMKFSTKDFLVNVTEAAVSTDLITFTEKFHNGRLHFLCSASMKATKN